MNNVYCYNKFTYLKVDTDRRLAYNCHTAFPHHIDVDWLEKNPGRIFNTPLMHQERKEMLSGIKNKSCYYQCYKAEDMGQQSFRSTVEKIFISQVDTQPKVLDIALGSDCNLTCVYCQADFSSAWRRDLEKNGEYKIKNSDNWENYLKSSSKALSKISQKEKRQRKFMSVFIKEIEMMKDNLERLVITGGEPFLNNSLIEILEICKTVPLVKIFTGLGISNSRFNKVLEKISKFKNIEVNVSNESVGNFHEFNRAGSSWKDFENKLKILKDQGVKVRFNGTVSNTVLIDLDRFLQYSLDHDYKIKFLPMVYPDFLRIHILDKDTKNSIKNKLKKFDNKYDIRKLLNSIDKKPTEQERINCSVYLKDFAQRRNFKMDIFPESFIKWLDQKE